MLWWLLKSSSEIILDERITAQETFLIINISTCVLLSIIEETFIFNQMYLWWIESVTAFI